MAALAFGQAVFVVSLVKSGIRDHTEGRLPAPLQRLGRPLKSSHSRKSRAVPLLATHHVGGLDGRELRLGRHQLGLKVLSLRLGVV